LRHFVSIRFWQCFGVLPAEIRSLARRTFTLLRESPTHPSLHFKQVNNGRYRSVRVGLHYRALGIPVADGVLWFWIGSHAEYDKLVG